jgi:hypothetical protein
MPRFHPSRDVAPGRDFPFMDTWRVAESLEFVADPERPVAVAARVADENIGHAATLRDCPTAARSIFVVVCALCKANAAGMSECGLSRTERTGHRCGARRRVGVDRGQQVMVMVA